MSFADVENELRGREIRRRPIDTSGEGDVLGSYTAEGMFVPDLPSLWDKQDRYTPDIPSKFRRREYAGRALNESLNTEGMLRYFDISVPEVGQEETSGWTKYLKYPLEGLKQLQRGQFAVVGGIEGLSNKDLNEAVKNFYRGLILAEEHNFGDLVEKWGLTREEHPFLNFGVGLAGDIILDPVTWFTGGVYGAAKGSITGLAKGAQAAVKMSDILPHLSKFGRDAAVKLVDELGEDAAAKYIIQQVGQGTKVGKKLIPSGLRIAHWVPTIKGQRVTDVLGMYSTPKELIPGGVMQYLDDINATQSILDKVTESMIASKPVQWLGEAFVPYWAARRKYPDIVELERARRDSNHLLAYNITKKLKEIVKTIDDPAEQKLVTDLIENPGLIDGKRLFNVKRTHEGRAEVHVNLDYFPDDKKITEADAEELVDYFFRVFNFTKGRPIDVAGEGSRLRTIEDFGMGGGNRSSALHLSRQNEKFEAIRPALEALAAAHPEAAGYKVSFGDFVIKIPVRRGHVSLYENLTGFPLAIGGGRNSDIAIQEIATVLGDTFGDAAAEIAVLDKIGGSPVVPDSAIVWRKVKDLFGSGGRQSDIPKVTLKKLIDVGKSNASHAKDTENVAWAIAVGGWELYKKAHPDEATRKLKNIYEYMDHMLKKPMKVNEIPIPVLVKKHVKGDVVEKVLGNLRDDLAGAVLNNDTAEIDKLIGEIGNVVGSYNKTISILSKAGIAVGDLHSGNFIMDSKGITQWIDNAYWTDHIRGIQGAGPSAMSRRTILFPGQAQPAQQLAGMLDTTTPATRLDRGHSYAAFAETDVQSRLETALQGVLFEKRYRALPGLPGFEARNVPIVATRVGKGRKFEDIAQKFEDGDWFAPSQWKELYELRAKHARGELTETALKKLKEMEEQVKTNLTEDELLDLLIANGAREAHISNMKGSNLGLHSPIGEVRKLLSSVNRVIPDTPVMNQHKKRITEKLAQYLKAKGIIKQYSIASDPANLSLRRVPNNLDEAIDKGYYISDFEVSSNHHLRVAWTSDATKTFRPISEVLSPAIPKRTWYEQMAVVIEKHPDLLNASPEKQERILKAYNMVKEWRTEIMNTLRERGLLDQKKIEEIGLKYNLDFLPRYKKAKNPYAFLNQLEKSIKSMQVRGINVKKHQAALRDLKDALGTELYETNILAIMARWAVDAGLHANAFDFITEAAKRYGKPVQRVEKLIFDKVKGEEISQVVELADEGYTIIKHPALKGIQLPKEVADLITRGTKTMNYTVSAQVWRNYHKILNIWKGYATFVNPGFHGRNFFSNLFQLYLKDGPEAINLVQHKRAVDILRGKDGWFKFDDGTEIPYSEVRAYIERHGVAGTGWAGSDIESMTDLGSIASTRANKMQLINPASKENIAFKGGRFTGMWIENEARVVGFLNDLKRTKNAQWSSSNTKKFFFDYSEITDFEKNWMKSIFPFYTWMRKNVALQAEQIIKQPAKYGNIARFKSNLEAASPGTDDRFVPEYFHELYAIRTPLKTPQGSPLYLNPNLPFQDFNRVFSPRDWFASMAPWKALIEVFDNKNWFTDFEIQKYEGEAVEAQWLTALPDKLLTKVGPMIGARKVIEPETNRWYWGINPKVKYLIESANPVLRNFGAYIPGGEENMPYYKQERHPYDVLSKYTGLKFIPYNPTENMERHIFKRRDKLRDIRKAAEKRGQVPSYYFPEGGSDLPRSH